MKATDHDHHSFNLLLNKLKHAYNYNMIDESNYIFPKDVDSLGIPMRSPHQTNTIGGLGMALMWYRIQGSCSRNLALLFSNMYAYV